MAKESGPRNDIHIIPGRASPSYIVNGQPIMIVDVGFPSDARSILDYVINKLGRDARSIGLIVLTHSHIDHLNGVDYLTARTGAAVAAHIRAQPYLTGRKPIPPTSVKSYLEFARFLVKHRFPRPSMTDIFTMPWAGIPGIPRGIKSPVDYWLEENQSPPGHPEWAVIHTLGHTDDGLCLYHAERRILFSGDTIINWGGRLKLNPLLIQDKEALYSSLQKLKGLGVDYVYPGWGPPLSGHDVLRDID